MVRIQYITFITGAAACTCTFYFCKPEIKLLFPLIIVTLGYWGGQSKSKLCEC